MKNYILSTSDYSILLENYNNIEEGNAEDLIALGKIKMGDGNIVNGSDFVDVVNGALAYFKAKHPYEYKFIKGATIIYLLDGSLTRTMCVDGKMNYYINVEFLYNKPPYGLGMNANSVFKILYHEAMHSMLEHIPRMSSFNDHASEEGKAKKSWNDMNIAGDLEINGMMVDDGICDQIFWAKQGGCYLPETSGLPFETILTMNDVLNKEKDLELPDDDEGPDDDDDNTITENGGKNEKEYVNTSREWKDGHRFARRLIRKLYKKNKRDLEKTIKDIKDMLEKHGNDMKSLIADVEKEINATA